MSEDAARFWNCLFSAITAIALLGGGLYTLKKYFDAREKDAKSFAFQVTVAQAEAQKQYYAKVLDLCIEVTTATSTIATFPDGPKRRRALADFKLLHYGPEGIIEDTALRRAMFELEECLQSGCGVPGQPDEKNDMLRLSHNIASSCGNEIIRGMNVGQLVEAPTGLIVGHVQ